MLDNLSYIFIIYSDIESYKSIVDVEFILFDIINLKI